MEPTWAGVILMFLFTVAALGGIVKVLLAADAELEARKAEYDYEGKYIF